MTSSQPAHWNSLEAINLTRYRYMFVWRGMRKKGRVGGKQDRKKNITSTFIDRRTGSCICFRLDLYMSHVNKIQTVGIKKLRISCDMYKSSLRYIYVIRYFYLYKLYVSECYTIYRDGL